MKRGDYNQYAQKYYWYFQFRNRYIKKISFDYGYTNNAGSCRTDHFKTIGADDVSDVTGDLINGASTVRVCVANLKTAD